MVINRVGPTELRGSKRMPRMLWCVITPIVTLLIFGSALSAAVVYLSLHRPLSANLLLLFPLAAVYVVAEKIPTKWGGHDPKVTCSGDGVAGIRALIIISIALLLLVNMSG